MSDAASGWDALGKVLAMLGDVSAAIGLMSGALAIYAYIPYMRDTLAGRTRPERASWLIWAVMATLSSAAQFHEGATLTLWFAGAQAAATVTIAMLSIRFGVGGWMRPPDRAVLILAAIGILLWSVTDSAVWTLAISIGVSMAGGTVTIAKAYASPWSETLSTWVLAAVSAAMALAIMPAADPILMAYPIYILTLSSLIAGAVLAGRLSQRRGRVVEPAP